MSCELHVHYSGRIYKKLLLGLLLLVTLLTAFVLSIGIGAIKIPVSEIVSSILGLRESPYDSIIWDLRLTRSIGAVLAGAGLGVSGAIMQNVLRNPLASPFTIGVSQGAAFGATFAIIVFGAGQMHTVGNEMVTIKSPYLVTASAFVGSLMTVFFILGLSIVRNITPESIVLAGVAISAFFTASTMFLQYFASDMQVAATVFWTFGDIGKAGWHEDLLIGIALLVCSLYFLLKRWDYNALQWGDDVAKTLGVSVKSLRILSLILTSLIVSVITSFLGIIGFIGLIAPHIVRFIIGSDYRFLIPYSALFGGLLLLVSDMIARTILQPTTLPVGIITSFAGAPLFLYLLVKMKKV